MQNSLIFKNYKFTLNNGNIDMFIDSQYVDTITDMGIILDMNDFKRVVKFLIKSWFN